MLVFRGFFGLHRDIALRLIQFVNRQRKIAPLEVMEF